MDPNINHPLRAKTVLATFLYNAFIAPFHDKARGFIYFVSFFFACGSAFLDLFLALDFAAMGQGELMAFLLAKFGAIVILIPLGLVAIGKIGDKILYSLFFLIVTAGLVFSVLPHHTLSSWQIGLFYATAVSPFWVLYHAMFATATSDSNIGNEVSLAGTGMTLGVTLGSLLGGFCSHLGLSAYGLIAGFFVLVCCTLALIIKAYHARFSQKAKESGATDEKLWHALKRCRYRSVGAFLDGLSQLPAGNLWVVYLSMSGIAAAGVGIWQAVMVIVKIFITPFAGSLVNHGRRREMILGAGLHLLGWAPFLYGATSFVVLLFMNVWAVGLQLFTTGLTSAWYGSRTIAAIAVREMILGTGRVLATLALVPLLYADRVQFINTVIILCALMMVYAALWMRSVRTKGPVLPIESIVIKQ